MARSSNTSVENNFTRGLITEATAMNYPENSVVETDNCFFRKNGEVIRRYGIDYEPNYVKTAYSSMSVMASEGTPANFYDDVAITEFEWKILGTSAQIVFHVQQIGDRIRFFSGSADNAVSPNHQSYSINLTLYAVGGATDNTIAALPCSYAVGNGYLVIVHPKCIPFSISYDYDTNTIDPQIVEVSVRDFTRVDDSLEIDERPASLTSEHTYNLYNQGWQQTVKYPSGVGPALDVWDSSARSDWPSNADIWYTFKNSNEELDVDALADSFSLGNTPAPNGHFIYSAFDFNRETKAGAAPIPEEDTDARPSCVEFYSGRIFYAGVSDLVWSSRIYFTKILESRADLGVCYQVADPTSEINSDLQESDGGVIQINDIAQITRIINVGSSLLVFATNGTWQISGSQGGPFKANDYVVTKISSIGSSAPRSVVVVEGRPVWWDKSGIYSIVSTPNGTEEVQSISELSIQSIIEAIPNANIPYVKGVYDDIKKEIHWVYSTVALPATVSEFYNYDKLLIFHVTINAFSSHTFSAGSPKVSGVIFTAESNQDRFLGTDEASLVKYVITGQIGTSNVYAFTIAQLCDDDYLDWTTQLTTGVDYTSYFITGYKVRGELLRKFQGNYVVVILRLQEDAGCLIQGVWDYANSPLTGHYTTSQQVYVDNDERDYSRRKLKIRGNGYSLQYKFRSQTGKPFSICGWATFETGNNVP